jgi:hypothetical protein
LAYLNATLKTLQASPNLWIAFKYGSQPWLRLTICSLTFISLAFVQKFTGTFEDLTKDWVILAWKSNSLVYTVMARHLEHQSEIIFFLQ